jgi:hypothetical protein
MLIGLHEPGRRRPVGVMTHPAVYLITAQTKVQLPEPGTFPVVTGEALLRDPFGQKTLDRAVMGFVTAQALALRSRHMREVARDQPANILVTPNAHPLGLIREQSGNLRTVRHMARATTTLVHRRVRTRQRRRHFQFVARAAEFGLAVGKK